MRAATVVALTAILSLEAGCHMRFRQAVSGLEHVRPQVLMRAAPDVQLRRGSVLEGELAGAVRPDALASALEDGLATALSVGPPFALTDDPDAPVLQVELVEAELEVPDNGPADVTQVVKLQLFAASGERLYRDTVRCTAVAPEVRASSPAVYVLNHTHQLPGVESDEVRDAFEAAGRSCGTDIALHMRHQATRTGLDDIGATIDELTRPKWASDD